MAALASSLDVAARLGRSLTPDEVGRLSGLLDEASALLVGYLGSDPTDTTVDPAVVPAVVSIVASRMVARVLDQSAPVDASSFAQNAGPFGQTVQFAAGTTSGQPWLTKQDKLTLRDYRVNGGVQSIAVYSERTGYYRTVED